VAVREGREKQKFQFKERKGGTGKGVFEWEQALKLRGREKIIGKALGARKPGKGSCSYVLLYFFSVLECLCGLIIVFYPFRVQTRKF